MHAWLRRIILIVSCGWLAVGSTIVFAQTIPNYDPRFQPAAVYPNQGPYLGTEYPAASGEVAVDVRLTIARIVRVALGMLGILLLVLILYAGFLWMTAAGNSEKVEQARGIITTAVIGLVIILAAVAITTFIINSLTQAISTNAPLTNS